MATGSGRVAIVEKIKNKWLKIGMIDNRKSIFRLILAGCFLVLMCSCQRKNLDSSRVDTIYKWESLEFKQQSSLRVGIHKNSDQLTITDQDFKDIVSIDRGSVNIAENKTATFPDKFRRQMIKMYGLSERTQLKSLPNQDPRVWLIEVNQARGSVYYEGILLIGRSVRTFRSVRFIKRRELTCRAWDYLLTFRATRSN